jgi:hypothetical protein
MTKISRIIAAASCLGVMGVAALPVAGYAATTTLEVEIGTECLIGDGTTGNDYEGIAQLKVALSTASPYAETSATSGANQIGVVCNDSDGWELKEAMDHTDLKYAATTGGPYTGATGFNVGAGNAALASFANKTWSIKYAGTNVVSTASTYNRSPSTTATLIAEANSPTALTTISQQFGAKTDGTVGDGYYGAIATYTLNAK